MKKIWTMSGVPRTNNTYAAERERTTRSRDNPARAETSPSTMPSSCAMIAIETVVVRARQNSRSGLIIRSATIDQSTLTAGTTGYAAAGVAAASGVAPAAPGSAKSCSCHFSRIVIIVPSAYIASIDLLHLVAQRGVLFAEGDAIRPRY